MPMAGRARNGVTTIKLRRTTKRRLDSKKADPRQSYDSVIVNLLDQLVGKPIVEVGRP